MCNIAGYAGTRRAAPILLEMLRRQEGFAGGYYTGIATVHEGKLYYAKLTGGVDRLMALTEAERLPGTVGIIHSRSNSGGGDEWAHPFLSLQNGIPVTAYVANGSKGFFKDRTEEQCRLAEALLADGYEMSSRIVEDNPRYSKLSDGSTVHMSDAMCQLIRRNMDRGIAPDAAMGQAFCEMPSEIVGLLLTLEQPDRISWARINYPMTLSFASHGAYLSSTGTAIPDDGGEVHILPANSFGQVFPDRYTVSSFPPPCRVAPLNAGVFAKGYTAILESLKEEPHTCVELYRAVGSAFSPADCIPRALLVYEVLRALQAEGRLTVSSKTVPGARPDLTAEKTVFTLTE